MKVRQPLDEIGSADAEAALAALCEQRLIYFIRRAWHILEPPSRKFVQNWHIEAICEHLEAVTYGEIQWLLVNVPPGHMKSLGVSVFWNAWEWGPRDLPWTRWLTSSYAQQLATRDAVRTRRLMNSQWFQTWWGDRFDFAADQDTKTRYDNTRNGYRIATSVGGIATGERGDRIIVDDPHNVKDAVKSETTREEVLFWWDEVMSTRYMDADTSARVIIMQRVHENDLSGHILADAEADLVHLMLPGEYEPERKWSLPGWLKDSPTFSVREDPRSKDGELLYPQRFSQKELDRLKRTLGSYGYAGQVQQRPAPREGGLVKLEWFQRYGAQPAEHTVIRLVQSWDTANKAGPNTAYSTCGTWLETLTGYYLVHVYRDRLNHPDLLRTVKSMADRGWTAENGKLFRPAAILIEEAASGVSIIQHLRSETKHPVVAVQPEGDKVTRLSVETPTIEAGRVFLPKEAPWLPDFEQEIRNFPNSTFMDQADMLSQTLKWFREGSVGPRVF